MGRRTDIDWDAIQRDYRVGQFSLRELARRHRTTAGSISRRARKHEWLKDYASEVRERTRAGLLETPTAAVSLPEQTDEVHENSCVKPNVPQRERNTPTRAGSERNTPTPEDIDLAVQTNITIVRQHRHLIAQARAEAIALLQTMRETRERHVEITEEAVEETKGASAGSGSSSRRAAMLRAINGPAQAQMLASVSQALAKVIPLERQAFGLDEQQANPGGESNEAAVLRKLEELTNGTGFRPVE
ncbi:MAG: hypothetical protein GY788_06785 [bacterium]|nr:hypothetical protein [bacterium]